MKRLVLALAALLVITAAAPAGAATSPKYFVDKTKLPFSALAGYESSTRVWGVHKGAGYRIEVPQNWNGGLVMWAHGYRGTGRELTVDDHPLRAYLVANGFAWAASSFSKNGYDPAQGAIDTNALTTLFRGRFGTPEKTYMTGASMGGHIAAVVAEQWPDTYEGAMPICGNLADYEQFDYYLDFNVSAQTLSGVGATYPYAADYLTTTVPATKAALGPAFPYAVNAQGQAFAGVMQMRSGGVRPLFSQGWLFWNGVAGDFLFGLGTGDGTLPRQPGVAVQNSDVEYQVDADPALSPVEAGFNATVQRVTADPQARRTDGLANLAPTTGDLHVPMLTLHTLGDLYVPFKMEQDYAQRVADKGASDFLVQRATRDVGHCSFTPREFVTAFADLVQWVETGAKPAGDDVLDPAAVADFDFGCTFTDKTAPRIWDQPTLGFLKPASCPT